MFRSHHFRRHVVESLEARRLLSTVSVYEWEYGELYVADGVSGQWSGSSQSDPRMTSAQPTVSLTVSGLPAHVRLIVSFGFESAYGNDSEDTETVSWAISDGPSDEWTFGPDYSSDGAHFTPNFAHSEDEFTLTLMASDQETFDYANPYSVFVSVVTPPTVSVSGGGTRAEDGSSATFTVSRDGNASLWSESLTVDLDTTGSTASPADYTTSSTGYEPVPSSVTIPAGLGSTTFTARPLHDSEDEQTETLGVAVAPSANYPVGGSPAQLVITDVVRSKQAVPVLFYHFEEVLTADLTPTLELDFIDQLQRLASNGFDSLTVEEFYDWRQDNKRPVRYAEDMNFRPFVMIFDDATTEALLVATELEKPAYEFVGVMAIPTDLVGDDHDDPRIDYMKWTLPGGGPGEGNPNDIGDLVARGWGVASHTHEHDFLGVGTLKTGTLSASDKLKQQLQKYSNTPSTITSELTTSKDELEDHLGFTPLGFVHPYDDITLRSLALAAAEYPVLFGRSFFSSDEENDLPTPPFGTNKSNLQDGSLFRIDARTKLPNNSTPVYIGDNFEAMLDTAVGSGFSDTSPFTYRSRYNAKDGTVIIDGTAAGDTLVYSGPGPNDGVVQPIYRDDNDKEVILAINEARVDVQAYGGNDTIQIPVGSSMNVTIHGGTGDDTMSGGNGQDFLYGEGGNDSIAGGNGHDWLEGGDGADIMGGGDGWDNLIGAGGNDTMDAGEGDDYLEGGAGHDSMVGGSGNDSMVGLAGNDILIGSSGEDTMQGGNDNDLLYAQDGFEDSVSGGLGTDTLGNSDGIDDVFETEA